MDDFAERCAGSGPPTCGLLSHEPTTSNWVSVIIHSTEFLMGSGVTCVPYLTPWKHVCYIPNFLSVHTI